MPNAIQNTWVNYVNNQRVNSSLSKVKQFTISIIKPTPTNNYLYKLSQIWTTTPLFSSNLSTYKIHKINLLSNSFTHNPHHLLLNPLKKI
jgi:hypothetical protein